MRLMRHAFGLTSEFTFTISANRAEFDLRTLALANGWNGSTAVLCVINSGVNVTSSSAATPAITITGSFPGGVSLTNNGNIYGMGGAGAPGAESVPSNNGSPGGTALSVSVATSVTNNGTIAGGGGGGGSGGNNSGSPTGFTSGGAGGNGAYGTTGATAGASGWSGGGGGVGGNGGALGAAGSNGANAYWSGGAGGAAGKSVNGNSNITWKATGTRTGPIA